MATFFVGQRVRVKWVRHPENYYLVGVEGHVSEVVDSWNENGTGYGLDSVPIDYADPDGPWALSDQQLEPILPEGMQPASWSDCAWQPEHMRQKA